jgi:hypothetical protein
MARVRMGGVGAGRPILAVFLLAAAARGEELSPEPRAALERVRKTLGGREPTAERAWAPDLAALTPEQLALLPDAAPEAEREAVRRVCRTALFRRGPLGRLERARDLCFLLAGPRARDWMEAYRLLRREPFSEDLDRAVTALAADERPEVRLIGIYHALTLVMFGREPETHVRTVIAGLTDRHPNVAGYALLHAADTRDTRVMDRMVSCLDDDRAFDPHAPRVLQMGRGKLSDWLPGRLSWIAWEERRGRCSMWPPPGCKGGFGYRPEYVELTPDEIRAWWRENRNAFGFGTPGPLWRCVFHKMVVVDVGKPAVVMADGGLALTLHLKTYREAWDGDEPVTTTEMEIRDRQHGIDQYVTGLGNPDHDDVWAPRSAGTYTWQNRCCDIACRGAFLPTDKPGRVRLMLTVHIGHEQPE